MQTAPKIRHVRSLNTVWISLIRQDFLSAMRDHEYSRPQTMRAISDKKDSLIVVIKPIQSIN